MKQRGSVAARELDKSSPSANPPSIGAFRATYTPRTSKSLNCGTSPFSRSREVANTSLPWYVAGLRIASLTLFTAPFERVIDKLKWLFLELGGKVGLKSATINLAITEGRAEGGRGEGLRGSNGGMVRQERVAVAGSFTLGRDGTDRHAFQSSNSFSMADKDEEIARLRAEVAGLKGDLGSMSTDMKDMKKEFSKGPPVMKIVLLSAANPGHSLLDFRHAVPRHGPRHGLRGPGFSRRHDIPPLPQRERSHWR